MLENHMVLNNHNDERDEPLLDFSSRIYIDDEEWMVIDIEYDNENKYGYIYVVVLNWFQENQQKEWVYEHELNYNHIKKRWEV